jgi:hypothetical protein
MISRGDKLLYCYDYIYKLLKEDKVSYDSFAFLMPYKKYVDEHKNELDTEEKIKSFFYSQFGRSFKALFKIKE